MTNDHTTNSKRHCTIVPWRFSIFRGGEGMKGQPIIRVEPMENGILCVLFDTGNSVTVDMKPAFGGFRFGVLQKPEIWQTADTDGAFVHWYKNGMAVAELAYNEIMKMTLGESY